MKHLITQKVFPNSCCTSHPITLELRRRRILGPAGVPQTTIEVDQLDLVYNTTIITNLSGPDDPPFWMDMRQETNDQWDFLKMICFLLETRKLKEGDILVMDNAKVHGGVHTIAMLSDICKAAGVVIRFMPNYSPEVNPAEQVHNIAKSYVRNHRTESRLWVSILVGHTRITTQRMIRMYQHCIK